MRVLHVVRNLEVGGMERFLVDLALEQKAQGIDVGVHEIAKSRSGRIALPCGLPHFPAGKNGGRMGRLMATLGAIRKFNPDIVHVHNTLALRHCILPCICFRKPMVMTKHGMEFCGGFRGWLYKWPQQLVCVSASVHEELVALHPAMRRRSSVIPNGVRMMETQGNNRDTWRSRFNMDSRTRAFVWVGRMVKEKGIEIILDAFATRKADPSWRLYMVGDGPLRSQSEIQAKKLGLVDRVVFLGMRNDVREILPAFDVFLLPSLSEGLPIALLEAAAAGLPLIVSNVGGMPDVVAGENGWVMPVGDAAELANCLSVVCVLTAAQLVEMGARSFLIITTKYSMSVCSRRYEEVYRCVLDRASASM